MGHGENNSRNTRIMVILCVFAVISMLLTGRVLQFVLKSSDTRRALPISLEIPGLRGKILGADGEILAWSERDFKVIWKLSNNVHEASVMLAMLKDENVATFTLPSEDQLPDLVGTELIVADHADYDNPRLWDILSKFSELRLKSVPVRKYAGKYLKEMIGETKVDPQSGLEIGISGIELKYDDILRAQVKSYELMPGSLNVTMKGNGEPENTDGENVQLSAVPVGE